MAHSQNSLGACRPEGDDHRLGPASGTGNGNDMAHDRARVAKGIVECALLHKPPVVFQIEAIAPRCKAKGDLWTDISRHGAITPAPAVRR